ncbi:unnamed protein product [Oncorhynchus mykiss]|uniref:Uncharacterized protein n=1 Tax=Oncorhynchus mykiss TaxID=8022 RepID=A0A060Z661_ONCMY|nr:unnamed protein product [Oncorhynchus mykiss]
MSFMMPYNTLIMCLFIILQSDRYPSGVSSDYYWPKSQGEANFSPLTSFQPPYQDRSSAGDGDLLVAALRHYLSGQVPSQTGVSTKGPVLPSFRLRPSYSNSIDSTGPKETSQSQTPNLDRLLLLQTAGASQLSAPKDPLSTVDEVFIQKVLKNVGRHDVDVDDLSPKDLDQLSTLITDALQVVDQEHTQAQSRAGPRDLGEEGNEGPGGEGPGEQEEKEKSVPPSTTEKTAESTPVEEAVVQERQMEGDREPADSNDKVPHLDS